MTSIGYGPPWRVNGPLPSRPVYGLVQAADAPAAGVTLVVDVEVAGLQAALEEAAGERDSLVAAAGDEASIRLALNEVADIQARLDAATRADIQRWINGVAVYPYPIGPALAWNACAVASEAVAKGDGAALPNPVFGAMTVYLAETCTAYQIPSQEEFKARALLALSVIEGAAVATEFLTGAVLPLNPHLADGNGTFPNADVVTSPLNALALLEGEIAVSGKAGLVHMSPQMLTVLRSMYAMDEKGGVIRTGVGTVVIPDAGYAVGANPAGHAAAAGTQEWMYATGPIELRRSEMFVTPEDVSQALDRGAGGKPNSLTYRAERYWLADWDTEVQAAVLADRCVTTCS